MANPIPSIDTQWLKDNSTKIPANFRFILMEDINSRQGYVRFSTEPADYITIQDFQDEIRNAGADMILRSCGGGLAKLVSKKQVIFYGESDQVGPYEPRVLEAAIIAGPKGEFSYSVFS